jgi:hypothetical protein
MHDASGVQTAKAQASPPTENPAALHTTNHGRTNIAVKRFITASRLIISTSKPLNMSDAQVTLRTRKFIRNPLLGRKQMVVCVSPSQQKQR